MPDPTPRRARPGEDPRRSAASTTSRVIVRRPRRRLGFWRDTLGLPVELVLPIETDRVTIAFLPVGESKVELVDADRRHDRRRPLPRQQGRGLPPRVLRGRRTSPRRSLRLEFDGMELIDTRAPQGRRGTGRVPPPAVVPRRPRGADRGAGRAGLGQPRLRGRLRRAGRRQVRVAVEQEHRERTALVLVDVRGPECHVGEAGSLREAARGASRSNPR